MQVPLHSGIYTSCNWLRALSRSEAAEFRDLEAANQVLTGRTEDHCEAAKAFVERAPVFCGR
jgi:hypothetical protein